MTAPKSMTAPNSLIVYRGPSMLDGAPIVVIATGIRRSSTNRKTGSMIQTWILRADVSPVRASKRRLDSSICGACPHRQSTGGACYVNLGRAPEAVYRAFRRGAYPVATEDEIIALGETQRVRAGSYGDPAAAPSELWALLTPWTGYTHQWRHPAFCDLAATIMASVDSEEERAEAQAMGWRTFRVHEEDGAAGPGEVMCPSVSRGVTCHDCGLCRGTAVQARSISIPVHGALAGRFAAPRTAGSGLD